MKSHRAAAEYLGGTKLRYTCPKGHTWVEDLGRKALPVSKRLSETGVRWLARWWAGNNGGVTIHCKRCH